MKIHKILLYAIILVLLYSGYAAPQYEPHGPALPIGSEDSIRTLKDIEQIRKAAKSGNFIAQYLLGIAYLQGEVIPQDYKDAVKWFRKAAKNGYSVAQLQLGMMYFQGNGVKQDYKDAVKWFRKAADKRSVAGQINLGKIYLQGKGVKQDYQEALKLFLKAAEKGNATAQCMLGAMYANAFGVTRDYFQAYLWLTMSIKGSNGKEREILKEATELRDSIAEKISPQQAAKAEHQVEAWMDEGRTANDVFLIGERIGIPVALVRPLPHYTQQARDVHIKGVSIIRCIVRKNGTVDNCDVTRELGYGIDKSAVKTVENKWRFQPGTYKGEPVDLIVDIEIEMQIY